MSRHDFDALFAGLLEPLRSSSLPLSIADVTIPNVPLVRVNAAFCALTGYAESEVVGRNCRFLCGPRTDPAQSKLLRDAIAKGVSARAVLWNYRRDGRPFLNEVIINPVRDASGVLRYVTGIQRDVTSSESCGVNRVRFALLPDGSLRSMDHPDGLGRHWIDGLSGSEPRRLANAATVVTTSGDDARRLVLKINVTKPDGSTHFEELEAAFVRETEAVVFEGRLSRTAQDTTLQGRLRLLEAVMSSAHDAIIITEAEPLDEPGPRILYANDSAERQTGYKVEQMIGRTPRMFQGPDTDRLATRRLGQSLRLWQPSSAQLLNYRADGSTFNIDLSITPVADEFGWWTHWISIQRDETERRTAADRIAHQAMHDSLTGLGNRRLLANAFDALVQRPAARTRQHGILQVDLDRFKSINDTFGHAAGDAILVETARRLQSCSRLGDTIARIGGDEFLIIVPEIDGEKSLTGVAQRVRDAVTGPFAWNDLELPIRASVGAALFPRDADDLDALMIAADVSLYKAKQKGRGCIGVFTPSLREEVDAARELGASVRRALEDWEFEPFFQPQFSLSDTKLVGLEALVRWRHPQRGVLAPDVFLSAAREAGVLAELDDYVMLRTLAAAVRWTQQGIDFGRVAVNLSSESFADPRLVTRLEQRLTDFGLSPERVTIEMVESVFIDEDAEDVIERLAALRKLGVSVDLDDFGTGYAALSHLRRFPIDRIKLDRSFVAEIGQDPDSDVIVSTIVNLARNLGLRCVAEGVETVAQVDFLRRVGCDEVQGYFFRKPMSEDDTTAWLAEVPRGGARKIPFLEA